MNNQDLNVTTSDQFASKAEVRAAIEEQALNPSPRITAAAAWILNKHPGLRIHTTESDLISAAYSSILGERNWNKSKVDFFGYVVGAMRSIASDETRKLTKTKPKVLYGQDEFEEVDSVSTIENETSDSPEDILISLEEYAQKDQRIEQLRSQLSDDTEASNILKLLLDHGLSKNEIREKLNMSNKQFWAADRRLQRAVEKLGD